MARRRCCWRRSERAARVHRQAGAGAGHRAGFRLCGARPEGRHHHVSGGAPRGARKPTAWRASSRGDIQFAELHDCFTIAEIIAIEDLGFVAAGEGGPYALGGLHGAHGERPVNTSGGLKSKGHPVGATGVGADLRRGAADSRRSRRTAVAAALAGAGAEPGRIGRHLRGHDSGGGMRKQPERSIRRRWSTRRRRRSPNDAPLSDCHRESG